MEILQREAIYLWYYFDVQLRQIFWYWVLGMTLGSAVSVFLKDHIHNTVRSLSQKKLGLTGIVFSSLLGIVISLYILCTVVFLLIENTAFGWESCKTSLQVPYSATSFLPINIGQTEIIVVAAGLLALFSTVCCILYLSSKMNTVYATTSVALLLCFIPMFISSILPQIMGMWVQCVLPTGGVGLLDSFFYELVDTNFLHIGSVSIWLPFMLLIFSIIEIPIWIIATIHSYTNHQI